MSPIEWKNFVETQQKLEKTLAQLWNMPTDADAKTIIKESLSSRFLVLNNLPEIKQRAMESLASPSLEESKRQSLEVLIRAINGLDQKGFLKAVAFQESKWDFEAMFSILVNDIGGKKMGHMHGLFAENLKNSYETFAAQDYFEKKGTNNYFSAEIKTILLNELNVFAAKKWFLKSTTNIDDSFSTKTNTGITDTKNKNVDEKKVVYDNKKPSENPSISGDKNIQEDKKEKDTEKEAETERNTITTQTKNPLASVDAKNLVFWNEGVEDKKNTSDDSLLSHKLDTKDFSPKQKEGAKFGEALTIAFKKNGSSEAEKMIREKFATEEEITDFIRGQYILHDNFNRRESAVMKDLLGSRKAELGYAETAESDKVDMSKDAGKYTAENIPSIVAEMKGGEISAEAFFCVLSYGSAMDIQEFALATKQHSSVAKNAIKNEIDGFITAKSFNIMNAQSSFQNNLVTFYNTYYNMSKEFGMNLSMIQGGQFDVQIKRDGGYYEFMAEAKGKPERYLSENIQVESCNDYGDDDGLGTISVDKNTEVKIMGKTKDNTLLMAFKQGKEQRYAWIDASHLLLAPHSNAYKWNEPIESAIPFKAGDTVGIIPEYKDSNKVQVCLYDENGQEIASAEEIKNMPMEATGKRLGQSIYTQVKAGNKTGYINAWGVVKQ